MADDAVTALRDLIRKRDALIAALTDTVGRQASEIVRLRDVIETAREALTDYSDDLGD